MKKVIVLFGMLFFSLITGLSNVYAANAKPTAVISGPANSEIGFELTFDGSGSSDPENQIALYEWDFGDGNVGIGVSVTHSFDTADNYTVQLTVTDAGGKADSTIQSISITAGCLPINGRIEVSTTGDCNSIQSAINAATDSTIIDVMPGTYQEDINIYDKEINLQGSGSEGTRLKPATYNGTAITMDWGYGLISGFSFISNGNSTAISLINAEPVTIKDNYFSTAKGVDVTNSTLTIKDNLFRGSYGIAADGSNLLIKDNTFDRVQYGVYVPQSLADSDLTIEGNNFNLSHWNGSTSIYVYQVNSSMKVINNRFEKIGNTIQIRNSYSAEILNNYINGYSETAGIEVRGESISIKNNYLSNIGYLGMSITPYISALIEHNTITNSANGIEIRSNSLGEITITNNHMSGNTMYDIRNSSVITPNVSFNVFDSCSSTTANANYNVSADGSSTVTCQ